MSRFFIHRPIFATVISLVIVIAGLVSQSALPVAKFPEITPPTVQVTCYYPGANAKVVADTVAAPIEQEVNGVEDMIYMSSVSSDDGTYTLTVTFEIGVDMDMATVLVQNRVSIANAKLPEEVRRQGVTTKKQSTSIIQFIALTSANSSHDSLFLGNYATRSIKDELSRIRGVGSVTVFGASDYSMRVWLNPDLLKARNLTTEDVVAAISEQNVQVAAGRLGEPPAQAEFELVINTLGRLSDEQQFENLIIKTVGQRIIRVKDVARVELGARDYKFQSTFKGQPCATLGVYQLPGANAMEVAKEIKATLDELSESFPQGLRYDIPFDTTKFVDASIAEVFNTLFVAVLLVVVVIYVFLQDWRATIVPCAAIPVALIGTFAVMAMLGFSINTLTLFGIVLAIGIVVDDAIVVVENTDRYLSEGLAPKQAAEKAMEEITGPVIATTLVLLAVFVPTAFMGGITGQLYRQFALTISAAVLLSTINALTLSPALCGIFMRKLEGEKNLFFRGFNRLFDGVTSIYSALIGGFVRSVSLVLVLFAGLIAVTVYGYMQIPTGFLPSEDQGYCFANIQLPDAASQSRTVEVMAQLDKIVKETPGVVDWVSVGRLLAAEREQRRQSGADGHHLRTVGRTDIHGGVASRHRGAPPTRIQPGAGRDRRGIRAATHRRTGISRWFPNAAARSGRSGTGGATAYRHRDGRRWQCTSGPHGNEHSDSRQRAAAVCGCESYQSQNTRRAAELGVQYPAILPRFDLCERLQQVGQGLSGSHSGRS